MDEILKVCEQFLKKLTSLMAGGASKGKRPENLSDEVLAKGMVIEAEHSADPDIQKKIVYDHVAELGPEYYTELEAMEKRLREKNG
jgi:hypothetical protein